MSASVFELQGSISMDSSGFEKAIRDAIAEGKNLVKSLADNTAQMKALQDSVNKVKAQLDSAEKSMKEAADATSTMTKEADKSADATGDLSKEVEGLKSDLSKAENAIEDTAKETKTLGERMDKTETETADLKKEVDNLKQGYKNAEDETKKIDDDTKKLGKTADETSEKFAKFANFMKTGFVAALKVGIGAIAAATTAVAGVVTKSVSAFGEYEQLKGGAQKIFDGMDFTRIQKDADNAFKELNMSASEYFSSINLAGATFAQTMGAEKGYETARKGMIAISDFATATGTSISELNEKYKLITRAASSYQSIADQFAGILPQTTADFLEQAQAAGYLSTEYTKLTDVPVAEYQQAVTDMIVKGVEAQGLASNTANEATGTLTGSFTTMKKAWDDLVVSFSDPDADLDVKLKNFTDSAEAAITNIVPTIQNALSGIGTAVQSLAPVLAKEAPKLIVDLLPPLVSATTTLISNLAAALPDILKALIDPSTVNTVLLALQDMWAAIWNGIQALTEQAPDIIPDLLNQIGNALLNSINMLESPLENIIYDLSRLIQKSLPVLIPIVLEMFKTILSSVATLSSALFPELADIFVTLFEVLKEQDMADVVLTIVNALSTIFEAVAESGEIIADNLLPIVTTLTEMLLKGFEEHSEEMQPALTALLVNLLKAVFFVLIDTAGILIAGALTPLVNAVIALWEGVFQPLDDKLSDGLLSFEEWLNGIKDKAAEFVAEIIGKVVGFFTDIGEKIFDFKQDVSEKIGEIIGSITSKFTGLIDTAKTWGKDLIDNFVGGITDKVDKVKSAISGVTDTIGEYIHFSEPDKGALADFHTFAPDMMKLFAQGIADNANLVYSEIDDLTRGISNDLAVETAPVAPTVATNGAVNNYSVNISFDGATISENTDLDNLSDTLIEKISEGLAMLDVFNTRAYGGVTI